MAPYPVVIMKYVIVTGGVLSGLGKGITASSIGVLMKSVGMKVTSIKIDPYLNSDAGTMSPFEHGETFVLDDGGETDLDLGNYERFLATTLTKEEKSLSARSTTRRTRSFYSTPMETCKVFIRTQPRRSTWSHQYSNTMRCLPNHSQINTLTTNCTNQITCTVSESTWTTKSWRHSSVLFDAMKTTRFS